MARRGPALPWLVAIGCACLCAAPPLLARNPELRSGSGPELQASRLQAQAPALSDARFSLRARLAQAPVPPLRDSPGQLTLRGAVTAKGGAICEPDSGIFRDGFEDP